ncbi:4'-phosphopantetheinyl transferase superfamily protein [Glycomyces sp. NPDC046736]|uniref:4'-phosphopantetheinyl transferase family protein n=1 Tax=Glycomyces sp. NPDC046736 TaxID=3155615 RepID=UPI0033D2E05B
MTQDHAWRPVAAQAHRADVDLWWIPVHGPEPRREARAVAAAILQAATGVYPLDPRTGEPAWATGEHGKPGPVAGRHWNLSHGRGWALVALAGHPVGVDLVHVESLVRPERVAARYFAPAEAARIADAAEPRPLVATALARKEALAKARGSRLLDLLGTDVTADFNDEAPGPVRIADLAAPPGHAAAAASEHLHLRQHVWRSTCDTQRPNAPLSAGSPPAPSRPRRRGHCAASTTSASRSPATR